MEARVVLITAPDEETARRLARGLVGEGLAACVNLIDRVQSIYRWEGAVEESAEVLMIAKTTTSALEAAQSWLVANHPYDVPEFVALKPESVEPAYLAWLVGEVE